MNIEIKYNDEIKSVEKGMTYYEVSKLFGMEKSALAVSINNQVESLHEVVNKSCEISFITNKEDDGSNIYKSGLKFLFEVALKTVFKGSKVYYEHSVPQGMLATVSETKMFTQEDLFTIRAEMKRLVEEDLVIKKLNIRKKEALEFYNKMKAFEKADNLISVIDSLVTIYELKGFYNYFYTEMPYSLGPINEYELVYLGNNKIIFLFPSKKTKFKVPEYVHYGNIISAFESNKKWLQKQNMAYINSINTCVSNGKIKDFIRANEIKLELNIAMVAKNIVDKGHIKFVLVAGPSSSGKTTTTKRLADCLEAMGYNAIKISSDDYFVDREDTPKDENGELDFESLNAIDLKYFNSDLKKLLNGEVINMPTYNFVLGKKEMSNKSTVLKDNSIILIEGLHSLNDMLLPEIDADIKYKIYLSPFIAMNIDRHNYVSTIDLRLIRRIVRDNRSRGYGIATTIQQWNLVRGGEEKHIFPYTHQADTIINTSIAYEIGVLKVFIEPLLLSVGINSKYYPEAQRLIRFLKQFFPIPGEYIPHNSILREFIGGSYD